MARLMKECEWKHDVNGFATEKVVRHVELFDKPSQGTNIEAVITTRQIKHTVCIVWFLEGVRN